MSDLSDAVLSALPHRCCSRRSRRCRPGTFAPEAERVVYGLTKNVDTLNPLRVVFHEYASIARNVMSATDWCGRLGYVFAGPGWRPSAKDGE
ncbi:hypothetical protein [Actinocorallia populi]|uniref:hypothetical protein n=1 Tax=Actinocorallia populi TaxID=2079200 RepID=UPI000D08AC66|nr:hypothetical protein [Actinocorallia populi]